MLERHYQRYLEVVYDHDTGLVRQDMLLSSTKDVAKRHGAFYDNVILWRTTELAQELEVIPQDQAWLDEYKQRILRTYWRPEGYFLEDLSAESLQQGYYSSDWLIAYQTGFLDAGEPEDQAYLRSAVNYVRRNALDQPFPIQYHAEPRPKQVHGFVRRTAPTYASTAIWSNWGMEYIKLLIRLGREEQNMEWLQLAEGYLDTYAYNIKRYRGYPEVYNQNGDFFRNFFYKSIRQTGWVVTYEQARAMLDSTRIEAENWK